MKVVFSVVVELDVVHAGFDRMQPQIVEAEAAVTPPFLEREERAVNWLEREEAVLEGRAVKGGRVVVVVWGVVAAGLVVVVMVGFAGVGAGFAGVVVGFFAEVGAGFAEDLVVVVLDFALAVVVVVWLLDFAGAAALP